MIDVKESLCYVIGRGFNVGTVAYLKPVGVGVDVIMLQETLLHYCMY